MAIAIPIKIGTLFVAESVVVAAMSTVGAKPAMAQEMVGAVIPPSFGDGKTPIGRGYIS